MNTQYLTNNTSKSSGGFRFILILLIVSLLGGMGYLGYEVFRTQFTSKNQAAPPALNCPVEAFRCSFEKETGVNYSCVISEVTANGKVEVARPEVKTDSSTQKGLCTFTPQSGKKYDCTVTAIREEGCFTTASGESSCLAISLTPSTTPSASPTIVVTNSPSPTPVEGCFDRKCTGANDKTSCANLEGLSCHDTDPSSKTDFRCIKNTACVLSAGQDVGSCWCQAPSPTPTISPSVTKTPTLTPTLTITPSPSHTPTDKPTPTPLIITLPPVVITSPPLVIKEPPVVVTTAPKVVVVPGETKVVIKNSPDIIITSAPQVVVQPPTVITTAPKIVVTTPIPEPPVAGVWDNGFYLLVMGGVVVLFGLLL